jgi:hypothetical protein
MRSSSWEQLSEALQRVMATGVTERKAKRDICQAIANQKIGLRLYFMMRPTRMDFLTGRDIPTRLVHRLKGDDIPPILRLGDFDWPRSRIRKSWLWQNVRDPSGSFFGNWRVVETAHYRQANSIPDSQRGGHALAYEHLVELRSADITNVFKTGRERAPSAPQPISAKGAKWRGVEKALLTLYPRGIPPAELTAKERNTNVAKWLAANGYSVPNSYEALARLIQRVLKALQSKTPRTARH